MPPQICLARGSSCDQKQNLDWFCSPSFVAPPSFLASLFFPGSSWAEVGIRWAVCAGGVALGCSYSTQKGARILIFFFFFFWDLGLLSTILIAQFFIMQDKALWAQAWLPASPPLISLMRLATPLPLFRQASQSVSRDSALAPVTRLTSSFLLVLLLNVSHTSRHGCSLWGIKSVLLV